MLPETEVVCWLKVRSRGGHSRMRRQVCTEDCRPCAASPHNPFLLGLHAGSFSSHSQGPTFLWSAVAVLAKALGSKLLQAACSP